MAFLKGDNLELNIHKLTHLQLQKRSLCSNKISTSLVIIFSAT